MGRSDRVTKATLEEAKARFQKACDACKRDWKRSPESRRTPPPGDRRAGFLTPGVTLRGAERTGLEYVAYRSADPPVPAAIKRKPRAQAGQVDNCQHE